MATKWVKMTVSQENYDAIKSLDGSVNDALTTLLQAAGVVHPPPSKKNTTHVRLSASARDTLKMVAAKKKITITALLDQVAAALEKGSAQR